MTFQFFFDYEGNIIDYFNEEYKDTDHGLEDNYSSWHELMESGYMRFNNCCFYIGTVHGNFNALILNIDDKAITFYSIYVDKRRTGRFYDSLKRDAIYVMDYKIDGDYLNLYIDKQLFMTYVDLDKKTEQVIRDFLKEENYNIKNVTWPRHADGSCDYDNANDNATASASGNPDTSAEAAIPKPAPAMGKTVTVTENLRLRTDDKTTAQVVTTLAAGARVKVEIMGKEETIDGITSNWVQVSVLDGAKDKDGNAIETGTKGWLFGGYLSEAEAAENGRTNENADAKKSSALPIVPVAAGGIVVFSVLLAVVLLVVKKRKACKD